MKTGKTASDMYPLREVNASLTQSQSFEKCTSELHIPSSTIRSLSAYAYTNSSIVIFAGLKSSYNFLINCSIEDSCIRGKATFRCLGQTSISDALQCSNKQLTALIFLDSSVLIFMNQYHIYLQVFSFLQYISDPCDFLNFLLFLQ